MHVLVVRNLWKTYRSGTVANQDVSVSLRQTELLCLMGPNGAGKSTFVRQIAGMLRPSAGDVWVHGVHVNTHPSLAKKYIGYQPQHLYGLRELTFREALIFVSRLRGLPAREARERVGELGEALDLGSALKVRIDRLSGGYRQLLGLSLALVAKPPLLVLDEPTAGLDPVFRRTVWREVHRLCESGTAAIVASHHLEELEDHMDRYAIMVQGKWVKEGSVRNLTSAADAEARVTLRVYPSKGREAVVQEALAAGGIQSRYEEDTRCFVMHIARESLRGALDVYLTDVATDIRGLNVGGRTLESYYLRAVEGGDCT